MRFRIEGFIAGTGRDSDPLVIEAASEREALNRAREADILVTKITQVDDDPRHTSPTSSPLQRAQQRRELGRHPWAHHARWISWGFKAAIIGVLLIPVALLIAFQTDTVEAAFFVPVVNWFITLLCIFTAAIVILMLSDIVATLRDIRDRLPPPDNK